MWSFDRPIGLGSHAVTQRPIACGCVVPMKFTIMFFSPRKLGLYANLLQTYWGRTVTNLWKSVQIMETSERRDVINTIFSAIDVFISCESKVLKKLFPRQRLWTYLVLLMKWRGTRLPRSIGLTISSITILYFQ